jgi:hypothetical protein
LRTGNLFTDESYLTGAVSLNQETELFPLLLENWTEEDNEDEMSWVRLNSVYSVLDGNTLWGELKSHPG